MVDCFLFSNFNLQSSYNKRILSQNVTNAPEELWFLCTALLLNEIYLPMKFHVNALYSFKVMLRTKKGRTDRQVDYQMPPFGGIKIVHTFVVVFTDYGWFHYICPQIISEVLTLVAQLANQIRRTC